MVNRYCNNNTKGIPEELYQSLENSKNLLNIALSKLKKDFSGNCFRGVQNNYDISKYVPGTIITEDQFISASTKKSKQFTGKINFIIKSKSGKFVKDLSAYPNQSEVLFRAGTKFFVQSMNINEIFIEEI